MTRNERLEVRVCSSGPDAGTVVAKSSRTPADHVAPWLSTAGEAFTDQQVSSWPRIASGVIHEGRWLQDLNRVPHAVRDRAWQAFNAYRMRPAFARVMGVIEEWLASNRLPDDVER